jgi:hypothetical protein
MGGCGVSRRNPLQATPLIESWGRYVRYNLAADLDVVVVMPLPMAMMMMVIIGECRRRRA